MREVVLEAVFGKDKEKAQEKIKKTAQQKGIFLSSTQKLYEKTTERDCGEFTVPAFNIRTLTFDVARALFRAVKKEKVGAFIVELANSEMTYTDQSPEEYVSCVLGAALKEKFKGPLFLQGDHFHPDPKNPRDLEDLIREVIEAGFYNIDIDCSAFLIKDNFTQTTYFTNFIRQIEPKGLTISVGGEIGEIGSKNTTLEELENFITGYKEELSRYGNIKGIMKVAVQTGTSHGKGGEMDFELLLQLSEKTKEYGLAGVVQHGASTLPEDQFKKFPEVGTLEIHLATEFQNIIFNSDYFPQELKEKVTKKVLGNFKKEIWSISQKNIDKICQELEEKFAFFFRELNVSDTSDLTEKLF